MASIDEFTSPFAINSGGLIFDRDRDERRRWRPSTDSEAQIDHTVHQFLEVWNNKRLAIVQKDKYSGIPGVSFESDELLSAFVVDVTRQIIDDIDKKAFAEGHDAGYAECMSDNYEDDDEDQEA